MSHPLAHDTLIYMPPVLYLIDGHALAYRTYYALTRGAANADRWVTRGGEPTAGVYGFASVLLRLLEQEHPEYLIAVFDKGKTFRDDLYPAYKGTREKMPSDLAQQIGRVRQLVDTFNIPRLEMEGYEADDLLGSLAKKAVSEGFGVKIITGDRDLLQLVDDRVIVSLPGRTLSESRDYLEKDVIEYLGVKPDQVVDYKALTGDKSDNIPGVAGIGEKTAVSLLEKYGNLDSIYAHLEELADGVRKKLEAGHDSAYLSRQLAALVTDLDLQVDLEKARVERFDPKQIEALFRELEFRSLVDRLANLAAQYGKAPPLQGRQLSMFSEQAPARQPAQVQLPGADNAIPPGELTAGEIQYKIINTRQALTNLVAELHAAEMISFDTETTSTDPMRADLVGISLSTGAGRSYYVPVGHIAAPEEQLPLVVVIDALRDPMSDPNIPKAGHHLKYDFIVLARYGLRVAPLSFDTMIAEWLINPISRNLGLKNLAWVRLGVKMTEIEELIGKGKNQKTMAEVPIPVAAAYAADDAEVIFRLMPQLRKELQESQATRLLDDLEMPLIQVLADMEMAGVRLDTDFLAQMSNDLNERMVGIVDQIYNAVGGPFNLNSPQQLSDALFVRLGLKPPDRSKRTSTGFYSTAADVLDSLSGQHPVVDMVLEYRELAKLKSTYVDALPEQVNRRTGRVHTTFSQTGSVTGRLASSDPNLQNIPIRTEVGRQVRRAFIADPGHKLISVDYSQVELRIVADMANDEAMLAAFKTGQDIHTATAAAIFGVPLKAVTGEQRRRAKAINFGLVYGMSPFGLTRYANLTLAEAEDFVQAYFQQFPGVKSYLDGIRRKAASNGYVETLLGRRRYFPGLKNQTNVNIRNREEREAINAPIQGTAADIMKLAMLKVPQALHSASLSARMLLQVHDELVLECPDKELEETAAVVNQVMREAYQLKAPLQTEARSGQNWYDLELVRTK